MTFPPLSLLGVLLGSEIQWKNQKGEGWDEIRFGVV